MTVSEAEAEGAHKVLSWELGRQREQAGDVVAEEGRWVGWFQSVRHFVALNMACRFLLQRTVRSDPHGDGGKQRDGQPFLENSGRWISTTIATHYD